MTNSTRGSSHQVSDSPGFSTPFIGRNDEIESIVRMLERPECRLVTVIGPGGVGKTRLAAEVAARISGDTIPRHFIDMATVTRSDAAALRIARAFDVTLPQLDGDGVEFLAEALRDRAAVAVLDNFDHLVDAFAEALGTIASRCPEVQFIVTSRVALNVQQEWRFNLPGLDTEGATGARNLFLDRASRVSGREPGDFDPVAVGRICKAVGGMPLAIEMAAAWTRSLGEGEIATELRRRLNLLTTTMRDLPERQRSMEAVFDQSCALLNEQERDVFVRLGIFAGGFTRGAAIDIAGASLPLIAKLVDHSLVSLEPAGRYRLHPLLWQYARNGIQAAGIGNELRREHCLHYLAFTRRQLGRLRGSEQVEAVGEMSQEARNLVQAWRVLPKVMEQNWVDEVLEAAAATAIFMDCTSRYPEGRTFATAVVALAPVAGDRAPELEFLGRTLRGGTDLRLGNVDSAEDDLTAAIALAGEHQINGTPGLGLSPAPLLPLVYLVRGEYGRAASIAREADRAMPDDDPWSKALALYCLGGAEYGSGEYAAARATTAQGLEILASTGDRWLSDYLRLQMAACALRQGAFDEAETQADAALRSRRAFEDRQGQAHALLRLGDVAAGRSDQPGARERYVQAFKLYKECSDRGGQALAQVSLARVDTAEGDHSSARARFLKALELSEEMGYAAVLADIFFGVAELQIADNDRSGAAMALMFVERWEKAPLAIQRAAGKRIEELKLNPATRGTIERQVAALHLETFCRAIERTLRKPNPENVQLAPLDGEVTRRELQVLSLLDRGYTNSAVAKELGLTVSTVKWYCTQIFGKLNAANRTAALARAREMGLLA